VSLINQPVLSGSAELVEAPKNEQLKHTTMENLNDFKYKRAKERVACIKGFYTHATSIALLFSH